uniref:Uncharacterized protein n=1 Tax=Thermosporothrix sp. COM3 TaxID=2490863 RepID=A0A455SYA8_9CHLR|nr:hypothetical protein KTC_48850 [Thermosporothrix sp. COM3]BBH90199.1 hypothetical protein KTC_49500 [Thermosporothrix sp. COM3]BBH90264.1 hypothetical protein KTC_50150 [Thermosporothrix sp. COM3]
MSSKTLSVYLNGVNVLASVELETEDTIEQRATARVKVLDTFGTADYYPGLKLEIKADDELIFSGYVDRVSKHNLFPNPHTSFDIDAIGKHYIADKRFFSGKDYHNQLAGDIFVDLLKTSLQGEGIRQNFTSYRESDVAAFQQGTLSNTVTTTDESGRDVLTLSPAGTPLLKEYKDFTSWLAPNTYSSLEIGPDKSLRLRSSGAVSFRARCSSTSAGNTYLYVKIYNGGYTIQANDFLQYEVWVSSTSPEIKASVDITLTDGTSLRDIHNFYSNDINDLDPHPSTDLKGWADDKWYERRFWISVPTINWVGKKIAYVSLGFEGDQAGVYQAFFRNIRIYNSASNATKLWIFDSSSSSLPFVPKIVRTYGYTDLAVSYVRSYDKRGSVTFAEPTALSTVGIYKGSHLSYVADLPDKTTSRVQVSGDNGISYLDAPNVTALPCFVPGQDLTKPGVGLKWKLDLENGSPDPTISPALRLFSYQINPAANTTKQDALILYQNKASWQTGTYNNVRSDSDEIKLNQYTRNWDDGDETGLTFFASNGYGGAGIRQAAYFLNIDPQHDLRARLNFAGGGIWTNFTAEIDILLGNDYAVAGLEYRTSNYPATRQAPLNSFAYFAGFSTSLLQFGKGSNSASSGSWTQLASTALTFEKGNWHRLKVVVNGATHKISIDDVEYISVTDSTHAGPGYIAMRIYNSQAVSGGIIQEARFDNFGIVSSLQGSWTSPALNLSGVGANIVGSLINFQYDEPVPSDVSYKVEFSPDNGASWQTVGKGQPVPALQKGANCTNMTQARLRATLSTESVSVPARITGLSLAVVSNYHATGSRVTPAIALELADRVGSTSLSWDGSQPQNTSTSIQSSFDGVSWSNVGAGASGASALPGIVGAQEPVIDQFASDTQRDYFSQFLAGGDAAVWTWDTANSRLFVSNGLNAVLRPTRLTPGMEAVVVFDSDRSENGGAALCLNNGNAYSCVVRDSAATSQPNTAQIYRAENGTSSLVAAASISFVRGTPHRFRFQRVGNTVSFWMDGELLCEYPDTTPLQGGYSGLYSAGGQNTFNFASFQVLSSPLFQTNLYVKTVLSTDDPLMSPSLNDLAVTIRPESIADGALIASTDYSIASGKPTSIAAVFDDLAKQSDALWFFDHDGTPYFRRREAELAPWIATANLMEIQGFSLENTQESYRNSQWITGAIDIVPMTETKKADGEASSWTLGYPVEAMKSISVDGVAVSYAAKGATGAVFYFERGSNSLSSDDSNKLRDGQIIEVQYDAQVPISVNVRDEQEIASRSAQDGTSGIVEVNEEVDKMPKRQALALAVSRLKQYAQKGHVLSFVTRKPGLKAGQLLHVYHPAYGLKDVPFLIQSVARSWVPTVDEQGVPVWQEKFQIKAVQGAVVSDWTAFFAD